MFPAAILLVTLKSKAVHRAAIRVKSLTMPRQKSERDAAVEKIIDLLAEHIEQMSTLQKMLDSATSELQKVKALHSDAEVRHQQDLEEANRSKGELENRLAIASERMHVEGQLQGELDKVRAEHIHGFNSLQEQVRHAEEELRKAIRSRAELETLYQTTMADLTRTKEDYEVRLSRATLQSSDAIRHLEGDLANIKFKQAEDMCKLEDQLKHSVEEVGRLQVRLQEKVDSCDRERQTYAMRNSR